MKIPTCSFQSDFRHFVQFCSYKEWKGPHPKKNLTFFLVWFQKYRILCSKPLVVSIMNCKSLCLSVPKTNVSTLAPNDQFLKCCCCIMLHSAKLFIGFVLAFASIWVQKGYCFSDFGTEIIYINQIWTNKFW